MRLSSAILSSSLSGVKVPGYDRSLLKPQILHIGVGNFHRAHMATYLDDLFSQSPDQHDWGIVGGGVLSFDADKRSLLEPQDWLQTLVERDADTVKARIIGSMIDFLPVDYQNQQHTELKQALVSPDTKIVSLTVTEGGYFLNNGKFDPQNPNIVNDANNPDAPRTVFGMMVQCLKKRRDAGHSPFTIMSCDNVPHNGDIVRMVVVDLAKLMDPDFANWISENVAFPNSMVDRITPATSEDVKKLVQDEFGYQDEAPVCCEPYRQWVLEDVFSSGRPALERVGVQFVQDVTPYETMKIRILNGGHASLCYPSALLGVGYVHEAMQHPVIAPFLDALERTEIIPSVPPVPDTDLTDYWKLISKRFSNPTIGDTIKRNCYDGASRQPKFIVPVAANGLKSGRKVDGLALVSALWCRYCQGKTEAGEIIEPNDPSWERLHETALKAASDPKCWLNMKDVYGDVGQNPTFVEAFSSALQTITNEGVEAAMKKYIQANS